TAMSDAGVVFATSAGNNGDVNFHLKKDFNNDSIRSAVAFYNYNSNANMWGQSLHAWGEVGQDFEMKIELVTSSNQLLIASPFIPASFNGYIDTFMVSGIDTVWYNVTAQSAHPQNNRPTIRFRVKKTNTQLKIIMNAKATTGRVHFWNVTELVTDVGNWGMSFLTAGAGTVGGDHFYGIGEPAASGSCISVAAHTSSYVLANGQTYGGARANFSSIGPRYDEVLKPDISAPGVGIRSSISSYTDNNYSPTTTVFFNGRTYPFAAFSGTSMSSPAVAGICALLLEANPYLSAEQVKDIIIQTRRLDNNTGNIGPNGDTEWGHGKINAYAAIQLALQTVGIVEPEMEKSWMIYPNPSADLIQIDGVEGIENVQEVYIIDATGKVSTLEMNSGGIAISNLPTGNYIVRFLANGKVLQSKFVKF
ncbi:S8 family peptidase, partial [Crocinitomicaceae bacterium]|nr:S8 family peptidase [Crocinitomicaceae bacterium]